MPGRSPGRDLRLAGGLQPAPSALRARDARARGVRRRVGNDEQAAGRGLTRSRPSTPATRSPKGGPAASAPAAIAATPRGYAARLRDDGRAAQPATNRHAPATPIRPPHQLPSRRLVSTTNSHSWWTDKRGPVTWVARLSSRLSQAVSGESLRAACCEVCSSWPWFVPVSQLHSDGCSPLYAPGPKAARDAIRRGLAAKLACRRASVMVSAT